MISTTSASGARWKPSPPRHSLQSARTPGGAHAATTAAPDELPVGKVGPRREDAGDDVVRVEPGPLEPSSTELADALDVVRRRPDRDALVDVPVHRLEHRVDEALVQQRLGPAELGPGD